MNFKKDWPLLTWCFLVFAFCGWLYELGWEIYLDHGFVNRGVLNGFYLPIYGFGGLALIISLAGIMKKKIRIWKLNITPLVVFVAVMVIATALEYVASCLIEDLFHVRYWDYSTTPYNLNGRVALKNSIIFGVIGILGLYGVLPFLKKILSYASEKFMKISAIVIISVIAVDILLVAIGIKFM